MTNFTTANDSADYLSQETANAAAAGSSPATKKHLLLEVPDYENATTQRYLEGKSYIELGNCDNKGMGADWTPSGSALTFDKNGDGSDLLDSAVWGGAFIDDGRYRGWGNAQYKAGGSFDYREIATPPNEDAARGAYNRYSKPGSASGGGTLRDKNAAASANIPSYVGWRDHTDGHRISTTRGDKIEVIGGNYRIVSLGRGTGVATYEMSGGLVIDSMEAPGNVTSVTWRECPTEDAIGSGDSTKKGGWKWVEQTVKGHEVERYHGSCREETYADCIIEVTGAPGDIAAANIPVSASGSGNDGEAELYADADGTTATTKKTLGTVKTLAYPTRWDFNGGYPTSLPKPHIYESTWASSVTEYEKVTGDVSEHVEVGGDVTEHYEVKGTAKISEKYAKWCDVHVHSSTGFRETWHTWGGWGFQEFFQGAFSQLFVGASTTVGVANRLEIFIGAEEQVNLGGVLELQMPQCLKVGLNEAKVGIQDLDANLSKTVATVQSHNAALKRTKAVLSEMNSGISATQIKVQKKILAIKVNL